MILPALLVPASTFMGGDRTGREATQGVGRSTGILTSTVGAGGGGRSRWMTQRDSGRAPGRCCLHTSRASAAEGQGAVSELF